MRKLIPLLFFTFTASAAPALFKVSTESTWTVTEDSARAGTIRLVTSAKGTRAEFRAVGKSPLTVILGGDNGVWLRAGRCDTDFATISAMTPAYTTLPALLLPFTSGGDPMTRQDGKPAVYRYRGAIATYTYDAKGARTLDIRSGGRTYTLTRTSIRRSSADASEFSIHPRKPGADCTQLSTR